MRLTTLPSACVQVTDRVCCVSVCARAQMLVDVLGVVVSVGASGTVKRKSDMSELARRDVTLADKR